MNLPLCYMLDLHSNHGGLAIVIVTIIHHIYFQFHCHDHTNLEPIADLCLDIADLLGVHVQHPPLLLLHAVPEQQHHVIEDKIESAIAKVRIMS